MATLNLDHLATFRLVISRGSFSGAAEVLGLSQPAVSLQIRQLEQTLKVRLIERTSRGVRPTTAGLTLAEHCMKIDAVVSGAVEAVSAFRRNNRHRYCRHRRNSLYPSATSLTAATSTDPSPAEGGCTHRQYFRYCTGSGGKPYRYWSGNAAGSR